jgi:hypothetical protein
MVGQKWQDILEALAPISNNKPVLKAHLERFKSAPDIYWYPGCGTDLSPLILDVPNNPTGERIYRLNGGRNLGSKPLILWMNDHSAYQIGFPRPGQIKVEYNDYRLFETDGWRGWEDFRARLEVGKHQESYLFGDEIPIKLFSVTVSNTNQGKHSRPTEGDRYLVIYSNCASHDLLRRVLLPFAIRPRCVALIRQGGFSSQLHYEQYIDLPAWLTEREKELNGPVDMYVIDAYGQDLKFKRPLAKAIEHYDYRGGPVPWGWKPCRAFGRPGLSYRREHKEN